MLLANWVKVEGEVEMLVWRPSFPSLASLGSLPPIVGKLQTSESSKESSLVACISGSAVI